MVPQRPLPGTPNALLLAANKILFRRPIQGYFPDVPLNNTAKKLILLTGMLVLMTAKIWIATRLIHRWKLQALAEGRPFGDAEDRIS